MRAAVETGDLNLAALNAIHCAISCSDAVCVKFLGERPAGQSHEDSARLLEKTSSNAITPKVNISSI